ncbi:hypothetical protein D5086_025137, partial [Populus alba]
TLNTLSDGDKSELVKFHVVPTFLSTSQFQTVSNPLGTWAGTGSRLPLNVTSYPNSVNITTGLTNTSLSGTVYTDNQLAIYKIEKVLLPKDIFASKAPAPAPVALAPEKPTKAVPAATVESPVAPVDISSALMFAHNNVVGSVGMVAAAMFALFRVDNGGWIDESISGEVYLLENEYMMMTLTIPTAFPSPFASNLLIIPPSSSRFKFCLRSVIPSGLILPLRAMYMKFTSIAPSETFLFLYAKKWTYDFVGDLFSGRVSSESVSLEDGAFSELKSGTLNTLSDGDKSELVKFHVVPTFLSTSQFQTVSNPLGTWAGTGSRLPLNVTSYPNSVNITTGLTNTSLSGTVYTDNQLAIYKIEKVLLPKDIFASKAPAPAPVALAPEKPTKAVPAANVESPVAPVDISSAVMFTRNNVVGLVDDCQKDPSMICCIMEENRGIGGNGAFSELKSGTLNTLSDGDKSELVKFHVVPTFLSTSQFQTVSNPLGTWAGTGSRLPLNVTSYPNSVNITTGLTNTSLSGTVYTDNQLAIYKIEKVLLPKDIFASKAPAPAPAAAAPEKPTKTVPAANAESPVAPVDISSAVTFMHDNVVGSLVIVAAAMFACHVEGF